MTHTPEQVELVARELLRQFNDTVAYEDLSREAKVGFTRQATALLDALRPLIAAQVRDECAKVADGWVESWRKLDGLTARATCDTARGIATAIREGRG